MHWLVKAQVGNAQLLHPLGTCHCCVSACSPSLPSESPMYMQQNTGAGGSATHTRSSRIPCTLSAHVAHSSRGVVWSIITEFLGFFFFVSFSFRKSKNTFSSQSVLFIVRLQCECFVSADTMCSPLAQAAHSPAPADHQGSAGHAASRRTGNGLRRRQFRCASV
jgi:hypothetical protein